MSPYGIAALSGALALAAPLSAQTVFGMDDGGQIIQWTGPSGGPCDYPNGPLLSLYGYEQDYVCPSPVTIPAAPSLLGDIAYDKVSGFSWVTDGINVAEYNGGGAIQRSFTIPSGTLSGDVTGMGYDASDGGLWLTDGAEAAKVLPPIFIIDCSLPATELVPAFALPVTSTATDISIDPASGTLFVSELQGRVTNVVVGGGVGPLGSTDATASGCLGTTLQGLTVDTAQPGGGIMWVTDGANILYYDAAAGAPAAPTFYVPDPCYQHPSDFPVRGLASTANAISFGSPTNGFFPVIGTSGHNAIVPNPDYEVTIAGTQLDEIVFLYLGFDNFCPGLNINGPVLYINIVGAALLGSATVIDVPVNSFPVPIPAGLPIGATIYFQGFSIDLVSFVSHSTRGLHARLARP